MKSILVIAPHMKIKNEAEKVAKNYDDVDVQLALLDEAIEVVEGAGAKGVEAIISRGGTAKIIKETIPSVPVIEMQVSPYDLLDAIYQTRRYGKNICIIGFGNMIEGVHLSGPILGANINVHHIANEKDGERYIKELIDSGEKIDALLGGTVAEKVAIKYNIPTVRLETSAVAIDSSIKEARRILEVARKEKEKTEQFKAILHYINEGVISIDADKRITTFNSAAEKLIGIANSDAIGKSIDELIPDTKLSRVLQYSTPELGQLIRMGKTQLLTNRVPILIKDKTVGAVATFQDVTKIREYEQQIRADLLAKGHVAKYNFSQILGESEVFLRTKNRAKKYAAHSSTVLIVGESGTGKEMFAQSIHLESERRNKPFVAINCAAIPQNLLESELFGYEEGAFTGARKSGKSGLFTEAHGGTIFLDEIGEINIGLQARLLRVLQEREVRPVGSSRVIPVDIRVIAATNKNLLHEVQKGNFREDLYYRIDILKLQVPSLRERKDDVVLLSQYFVSRVASRYKKVVKISKGALDQLRDYHWPGNIRELENVIERLVVLNDGNINREHVEEVINEQMTEIPSLEAHDQTGEVDSLEEVKRKHIHKILSECEGNQTLAANRLGISRTHLWRMINNYEK